MIELKIIIIIFVFHWINDFIMQDESWAINKSHNFSALLMHTLTYSVMWVIPLLIIGWRDYVLIGEFVVITFIAHTITDFITSKRTSKLYAEKKFGSSIPNLGFFSMIGFDQVLHYLQLFLTYWYLTK